MRFRTTVMIAALMLAAPGLLNAQRGGRGAAAAAQTPKAAAAIDLTGYWVSIVTEDWKFRMVTPNKGEYGAVPISAEGRRIADAWDPTKDEAAGNQCKSYGAAALMRMPGRLHITWENDATLRIDTDAGTQTRLFHFGAAAPATGEPAWQGNSVATWEYAAGGGRGAGQARTGNLKVVTTNLRAGYVR